MTRPLASGDYECPTCYPERVRPTPEAVHPLSAAEQAISDLWTAVQHSSANVSERAEMRRLLVIIDRERAAQPPDPDALLWAVADAQAALTDPRRYDEASWTNHLANVMQTLVDALAAGVQPVPSEPEAE